MTEQQPVPPRTGVAEVDATLADVAAALRLPVAEQVGPLEQAHDRLRRALDAPDTQA